MGEERSASGDKGGGGSSDTTITLMNLQMLGITEKQSSARRIGNKRSQQNGHSNNSYISEAARKPKSEQ